MSFEPSKFSIRVNPPWEDRIPLVEVVDGLGGRFRIDAGKGLRYLGGGPDYYPAPGRVFTTDDPLWGAMVGNFASIGGQDVLLKKAGITDEEIRSGKAAAAAIPATMPEQLGLRAQGAVPTPEAKEELEKAEETGSIPLPKRRWFWPTVILGSTVLIGGGIVGWTMWKRRS